jgi:hypothetical protein
MVLTVKMRYRYNGDLELIQRHMEGREKFVSFFENLGKDSLKNNSKKMSELELFDRGVAIVAKGLHLEAQFAMAASRGSSEFERQNASQIRQYDDYYLTDTGHSYAVHSFVGTTQQHKHFEDAISNNRDLFPRVAFDLMASFGSPEMNSSTTGGTGGESQHGAPLEAPSTKAPKPVSTSGSPPTGGGGSEPPGGGGNPPGPGGHSEEFMAHFEIVRDRALELEQGHGPIVQSIFRHVWYNQSRGLSPMEWITNPSAYQIALVLREASKFATQVLDYANAGYDWLLQNSTKTDLFKLPKDPHKGQRPYPAPPPPPPLWNWD